MADSIRQQKNLNFRGHEKGLLYSKNGSEESEVVVHGPFTEDTIRELLVSSTFQMVPFTIGQNNEKKEMWVDEEGPEHSSINRNATDALGLLVMGDQLYGNVLVVNNGAVK